MLNVIQSSELLKRIQEEKKRFKERTGATLLGLDQLSEDLQGDIRTVLQDDADRGLSAIEEFLQAYPC